jgi:hypothetical protein
MVTRGEEELEGGGAEAAWHVFHGHGSKEEQQLMGGVEEKDRRGWIRWRREWRVEKREKRRRGGRQRAFYRGSGVTASSLIG